MLRTVVPVDLKGRPDARFALAWLRKRHPELSDQAIIRCAIIVMAEKGGWISDIQSASDTPAPRLRGGRKAKGKAK